MSARPQGPAPDAVPATAADSTVTATRTNAPRPGRRTAAMAMGLVLAAAPLAGCGSHKSTAAPSVTNAQLVQQRQQAGIAACPSTDAGAASIEHGLPAVSLDCMGSDVHVNMAGLAGKPTVVNFWAQWCGPCRTEGPMFGGLWKSVRGKGTLAMIGVDEADLYPDQAITMAAANGQTYPLLVDAPGAAKAPFGFANLPQTFFVDAHGRIVHRQVGLLASEQQLRQLVKQYLGVSA